jgi:hypothetical protein
MDNTDRWMCVQQRQKLSVCPINFTFTDEHRKREIERYQMCIPPIWRLKEILPKVRKLPEMQTNILINIKSTCLTCLTCLTYLICLSCLTLLLCSCLACVACVSNPTYLYVLLLINVTFS